MNQSMNQTYHLFRRPNGVHYSLECETDKQLCLKTKNKTEAIDRRFYRVDFAGWHGCGTKQAGQEDANSRYKHTHPCAQPRAQGRARKLASSEGQLRVQ
jgi:hypothetical protein